MKGGAGKNDRRKGKSGKERKGRNEGAEEGWK
jgi:hypothetical protein